MPPSASWTSRPSPRHRPPLALRMLFGVVALGALAVNAVLMLSDRAPGALRRLSDRLDARGARAREAAQRITTDSDVLDAALAIHIAVWAVAALAIGLAVWTWRGLFASAIGVFAVSGVVEAAQQRLTDTRVTSVRDLVANGVGVALGVALAAGCYVSWSALASLVSGRPRRW